MGCGGWPVRLGAPGWQDAVVAGATAARAGAVPAAGRDRDRAMDAPRSRRRRAAPPARGPQLGYLGRTRRNADRGGARLAGRCGRERVALERGPSGERALPPRRVSRRQHAAHAASRRRAMGAAVEGRELVAVGHGGDGVRLRGASASSGGGGAACGNRTRFGVLPRGLWTGTGRSLGTCSAGGFDGCRRVARRDQYRQTVVQRRRAGLPDRARVLPRPAVPLGATVIKPVRHAELADRGNGRLRRGRVCAGTAGDDGR